jgi:hypothetical protein
LCQKAGPERQLNKRPKSRTNYKRVIFTTSLTPSHTTLFRLTNLDVMSGLGFNRQAGHNLVEPKTSIIVPL